MRVRLLSKIPMPSTTGNLYMVEYEYDIGGEYVLVSTAGDCERTLIRLNMAMTAQLLKEQKDDD